MISCIKIYKAIINKRFLSNKAYRKIDITRQLEMPIYDTAQLDGVLDTTRISLINKSKTPLKPLTRIIIELYDNDVLKEKIYRVVDNDKVENTVLGSQSIYRHSISLIEITKILERRTVDNLTFTNYLHDDTARDVAVGYTYKILANETYDIAGVNYTTGERFFGPYHLLGENDTISTNISLNVNGIVESTSGFLFWEHTTQTKYALSLKEFYVVLPNGEKKSLTQTSGFTYKQKGKYKFIQRYYREESFAQGGGLGGGMLTYITRKWDVEFSWVVEAVADAITSTNTYTILQALERLLKCHVSLINDVDHQEFVTDGAISDRIRDIKAPEFSITEGTLFEGLTQIGNYIHAIPRLIPSIVGDDDYSLWNTITFDFLDAKTEFKHEKFSLIDFENPSEEYAKDFVSNVQNATITNYTGKTAAVEPIRDGFLSIRTESSNFEVSDNECVIKTRERIKKVIKVKALISGVEHDISSRVIEKAYYNLKSDYNYMDNSQMKSSYLYYAEGERNIRGLNFIRKSASSSGYGGQEAIKNILQYSGNIKDIAINIEYVPWVDFKARQFKTPADPFAEDSSLFYNQQANEIDIDAYGENMFFALSRTGNVKIGKTQYFEKLEKCPQCGQFYLEDGEKYIAFQTNRELSFGCPIKATTMWAKNYNELFADVAVKKAIRQFEISERECVKRNIDVQNFCVIDTGLDLDEAFDVPYEQLTQQQKEDIMRMLWDGFGHPNNLAAISKHLNNSGGTTERITTAAICRIKYKDPGENSTTKNILCPASFHSFGRAIVCRFSMEDNYSAGTFIDTAGTGREDVDVGDDSVIERPKGSYAIENYIQYGNKYGRTEYLEFALVDRFKKDGWTKQGASYYLYDIDDNDYFRLSGGCFNAFVYFGYTDANHGAIVLDKDSREQISVACQLNFISFNENVYIFKPFIDSLPYICDSSTTYKEVIFDTEQDRNFAQIKGGYTLLKNNLDTVASNYTATITVPSVVANASGKGYGIITDQNELCVFVRHDVKKGNNLPPIHMMFRHKI